MNREPANRAAAIGLTICLALGALSVVFIGLLAGAIKVLERGNLIEIGLMLLLGALLAVLLGAFTFFLPYGFLYFGIRRLRQMKGAELPDDNTVGDPEEGEKKFHQWLTAVNSFEAYIGMVPRSEPYVPPEKRTPADVKPSRALLGVAGMRVLMVFCAVGAIGGVVLGVINGADIARGDDEPQGFAVLRLFLCSILGALAAVPAGFMVALLFARVIRPAESAAANS
jgi:hypothetical protein